MLRHNANTKLQADFLKVKVAEAQKTLQDALTTSDTVSKDQKKTIEALEKSVDELKKSVEDLKASKSAADEAVHEARGTIATLEGENDTLKAKVTMLEENLATERDTLAEKVADAEDKFTDLAWYRCWVNNPDIDLAFLEGGLEKTLAIWQTRLKEEEEDINTILPVKLT